MAFEPRKFSELYDAMRARTTGLTDFEVGSVTRTMYESFAYELGLLYQKMHLVYLSGFVDTAGGTHLDQVVGVLGIQRSLPDFAVGEVVFLRDKGNAEIVIPAATLVATEDLPEKPKKVYQTLEPAVLAPAAAEVRVKVQAVERGEEQNAAADAISVMPRPIPGVKSVQNPGLVRLTGRSRETDDELRSRAKNALLSSGKANIAAIENAVISLPEVRDVQVREYFHFARGPVSISRGAAAAEVVLPKGTLLATNVPDDTRRFRLLHDVVFAVGENGRIAQIEALAEGRAGEMSVGPTLQFADAGQFPGFTFTFTSAIRQGQFGMAEVVVDTEDFPKIRENVRAAVERVRAAGIYVTVTGATRVDANGVFRIETAPGLKLTPDERLAFEEKVRQAIVVYFQEIKMGQPALFSKLMKAVLSVEGVENLADFRLSTTSPDPADATKRVVRNFEPAKNKIEAAELDRFSARHLSVASEDKALAFHVVVRTAPGGLDANKVGLVRQNLERFFNGIAPGGSVGNAAVRAKIQEVPGVAVTELRLRPVSWSPDPAEEIDETAAVFPAKFVEKPVLGSLFAYSSELQIRAALLLVLPDTATAAEKSGIRAAAAKNAGIYLGRLLPEMPLVVADLLAAVRATPRVLDVAFDVSDLEVLPADGTSGETRLTRAGAAVKSIKVNALEKAVFGALPIVSEVAALEVSATDIELKITQAVPAIVVDAALTAAVRVQVKQVFENFLLPADRGKDLVFAQLLNDLRGIPLGFGFSVAKLDVTAATFGGFPAQTATLATPKDILVRSVQAPEMKVELSNIKLLDF